MELVADRFLRRHDRWFDIATAREVTVRVLPAGPRGEQLAWAERCAMLAVLRHPLLNALIDFGAAGPRSLFEAFEPRGATGTEPPRATFLAHARRFVEAHGVAWTPDLTRGARRSGSTVPGRPLGIVLQPRRALATVADLLACPPRGGVTSLTIAGPPGSGLRTLVISAAHLARAAGYVPVCPAALVRWPELAAALGGRHVCILAELPAPPPDRLALASLLVTLAQRSARAHVCLTTSRAAGRSGMVVHLDPMGTAQMSNMIYLDRSTGPTLEEVFAASRRAAGNPGRLLAELGARPFATRLASHLTVHESRAVYGESIVPGTGRGGLPVPAEKRRLDAAAWRARPRALELVGRGRHAAAGRLLARAARLLEGRGEGREASQCWLQLAWMTRNRGATVRAVELAARAAGSDASPEGRVAAACLVAVCWTDDGRLTEAEASLRSLAAAAATLSDPALNERCLLALARVLHWSRRADEALATLAPLTASPDPEIAIEALARRARARLMTGDLPSAVQSARDACRRAAASAHPRLPIVTCRAMAEVLLAVGDAQMARAEIATGLSAAASARLPLALLRLRLLMLRAMTETSTDGTELARLRAAVERCRRRHLPALVERLVDEACGSRIAEDEGGRIADGMTFVGRFLEAAQRAPDDKTALAAVLDLLLEQVRAGAAALVATDGRVLATAGRSWRERSVAAEQALASGLSVVPQPAAQQEAAEPVRCGGALIAAIACRWSTGACPPAGSPALLHAASLAIASHARAVLEAAPVEPPPGVWGDLLGESAGAGALRDAIVRASRAPFPVLIEGESGSGKELVARAIHRLSARHARRFCAINCAALGDELVEAELFGHTRGAFTGAATDRSGLFEEADGGTLFLDEIGELSARAQAKLLRVLQEGEVRRVGENLPRRVDVRIVAATNRRLDQETAGGRFRTDLHFRLDVLRINVPPLRERATDIPMLAQHFWQQACARLGSKATLGADAITALTRYDWPGNVRELQNTIAWMAVHGPRRGRLGAAALPARLAARHVATGTFEAAREEFERRYVRAALAEAGGQRQVAARALGISRQGLAKMLRRLGIER